MRSMVEGACGRRYRLACSLSTTAFGGGPPLPLGEEYATRPAVPPYPTGYPT